MLSLGTSRDGSREAPLSPARNYVMPPGLPFSGLRRLFLSVRILELGAAFGGRALARASPPVCCDRAGDLPQGSGDLPGSLRSSSRPVGLSCRANGTRGTQGYELTLGQHLEHPAPPTATQGERAPLSPSTPPPASMGRLSTTPPGCLGPRALVRPQKPRLALIGLPHPLLVILLDFSLVV